MQHLHHYYYITEAHTMKPETRGHARRETAMLRYAADAVRKIILIALLLNALSLQDRVFAEESVARIWDEQLLHAISIDTARPTVHSRNLFHLSAAMYDAWAAYDGTAKQYFHNEAATAGDVLSARNEAISHAAFGVLLHRFHTGPGGVGPGRDTTLAAIRQQMSALGYDPDNLSTIGDSPAAVGNRVAQSVINASLGDGANELNNYATPPGWEPVNDPLTFDLPGAVMNDPTHWQPLHFLGGRIDQFGRPINEATQKHLGPYWGDVKPFALTPADRTAHGDYYVYHDQGIPPGIGRPTEDKFKADALMLIRLSSQLDPSDGVLIDISPATRGNTPDAPFSESYDHVGHATNPYTGLPYEPHIVKQGDFGRIVAEFWADGPHSTAPPGHWNEISNDVTDKMEQLGIPKRIGGVGPVVSDLEWDVKKYLVLNAGMHDAAVASWNHKGVYDSPRPISFIRYMGQLGQSTDPNLTVDLGGGVTVGTYHPHGLPLEDGLVEVVTADSTAPGQRHEHLAGSEGKIAVRSWQGAIDGVAPFDDPSDISGVDWILAETWMPYQLSSFVTPPFAGYVSGHSTFSRTGAEVMALLTGSEYFPGGIFEYEFEVGSGLDFEYGPTTPFSLQFATYFDASDQASMSRIYGGIHPSADDFTGRRIGNMVGPAVFAQAMHYFTGVPEPSAAVLMLTCVGALGFAGRRRIC